MTSNSPPPLSLPQRFTKPLLSARLGFQSGTDPVRLLRPIFVKSAVLAVGQFPPSRLPMCMCVLTSAGVQAAANPLPSLKVALGASVNQGSGKAS